MNEKEKQVRRAYEERNRERIRETKRLYRLKNIDRIKEHDKIYYIHNRIRLCEQKKEYYEKNKEIIIPRHTLNTKNRRKKDSNFAIMLRLRSNLFRAISQYKISSKIVKSAKYNIDYGKIIEYLKPFPINVTEYHIDHIKPLCSFNLSDPEEIKKAFAPENHQWLLGKDNLAKVSSDLKQSTKYRC